MKTFRTEFQVRGYELDGYGHVNHAVYLNYAEFARWRMIEDSGAGSDYFARNKMAPVVVRVEVDYKEPCYLAEWVVVETSVLDFRKRTVRFAQKILKKKENRIAAEVIVTAVVVNSKGKAISLPKDFELFFGGAHDEGHGE